MRVVVPFPAGGGIDLIARLTLERLRSRWPQGAIVDNRTGANSLLGAEFVLGQPRDGQTLLVTNSTTFILPVLMNRSSFRPLQDFVAVSELIVDQLLVYVRAGSDIESMKEVLDIERSSKLNFGSYGVGSNPHLLMEELNRRYATRFTHIPYKGAALLAVGVIGDDVQLGVAPYAVVRPFFESGKLRPIAVFGSQRLSLLPKVPTLGEAGIASFESNQWTGIFAARGTPEVKLNQLAQDFQSVLQDDAFRAVLAERGTVPGSQVGATFDQIVQRDAAILGKMNVAAGIRLD